MHPALHTNGWTETLKQEFEDSLQMVAAAGIPGINSIVTRNLKDFKHSEVEVRSPDEFVKKLK